MKKLIYLLAIILSIRTNAQTNLNLYNFRNVGQSNLMNPGIRPLSNFTLGLPSFYISAQTPEITLAELFNKNENIDSTFKRITRDPNLSFNNLGISTVIDPLFIGFGIKKNYFSMGIQASFDFYGSPPKDILGLTQGSTFFQNSLNRQVDLGNVDFNSTAWVGIHLGYTREIGKKLSLGFRVKYLLGIYNLNVENSTLKLSTNEDSLYIKAGYKANTAGTDNIDKRDFGNINNAFSGSGWGIDFGGKYKFNQHVSVSASVVDFGWITWDKNTKTYNLPTKEFNYKGIDVKDISANDSIGNRITELQDSITKKVFVATETTGTYTTNLNAKLYIGAQYALNYNNMFDFVFFNNFGFKTFNPALSISFTKKVWSLLDLRISGTYYNKTLNNAGLGVSLNLGPFQTYLFSDNLIAVMQYDEAKFINIRAGVNFNFGRNNDRDGDGIPNKKDKCKKNYGSWNLNGCPDTDKDGITDKDDNCMYIPGAPCAKGCPDKDNDCVADKNDSCLNDSGGINMYGCPDKDNDGVADKDDKCPRDSGSISMQGCPDSDNDGIIDNDDVCPDEYGKKEFDGCPDIDNDGVPDYQDSCRLVAGLKMYHGCPDSDGDGIIDKIDKCPTLKGSKVLNGCPDADEDGITDLEDNCPTVPGPASNFGCPQAISLPDTTAIVLTLEEKKVLNEAFSNLEFETGTSQIKTTSLISLEELANLLVVKSEYKLSISGYTDNVGNPKNNLKLSQSRADAVKSFLVTNGVQKERLTAKGFGSKNPIASNKTTEGKARNRRVEFKILK